MTETVSLAYDIDGSGPLLVAIHGMTENRHFWDRVPLAEHFRTLRVDLRGHGDSPHATPYDPLTMAGDVHAVLMSLGIEQRPLVMGHSYGGMVATAYASRFPVRGVVNIDQTLNVTPLPGEAAAAVRGPGYQDFLTAGFARMYGQLDPALTEELGRNRRVRQDVLVEVWAPLLDLGSEELTAYIANLTPTGRPTPYLALHGSPVDDAYREWLHARIPGAAVEAAPATTHYPHLADPGWFVRRLTAFAEDAR
ncbi:alpha/beta fold hydrolase [Plantactinospora soyae]|uniref:Pimeloyl-ACP methyl ester carboxylesterase n=1 Tax=Plantactinospora soyae TaxID=1544732 RepID=A0A927R123_9ACTN|nr:alpha/beta hydrolase [Plantactinospora soyae]MBE1489253.1 pimeloyl-ACP methyl ester carboxylesterase [Plantactinospora soyae]